MQKRTEMRQPIYHYWKIVQSRNEYLGIRYFKVDMNSEAVIQICVSVGETKKGRGHTFGIYVIDRMTFFSNYLGMGYAEPCDAKEYKKEFKRIVTYLE